MMRSCGLKFLILAVAAIGLGGGAASADFGVRIFINNTLVDTLSGTGIIGLDSGMSGGVYTVGNGTFTLTGAAASNSTSPTGQAEIDITGTIEMTATDGSHVLSIVASDNNFTFPAGTDFEMTSSASGTFQNSVQTDSLGYTGGVVFGPQPVFTLPDLTNDTITLTNFNADPAGVGVGETDPLPRSYPVGSGSAQDVKSFMTSLPFGLNASLTMTFGPADLTVGPTTILPTVSTIVRAVPEPGSIALLGVGALGAVGLLRRRRR